MSEQLESDFRSSVSKLKDLEERKFHHLVDNFYVLRSALRYYKLKKGISFTSSRVAEDFPLPITVAGSSLEVLAQLEVVEKRTKSSSPDRYLPAEVDLDRMERLGDVLRENHEIREFF